MSDDFGARLTSWYALHKRDLPWRGISDPYKVWLSEVILQQTRVVQGLDYYHRFISEYPDIFRLAGAKEEDVLKMWQGLGYYSRAINLLKAARRIVNEYDGKFPQTTRELMKIEGVGPYTAAAIASIVYREAEPVLDGNVFRVLSRILGISSPVDSALGRKRFRSAAKALMEGSEPGTFNEAMMEFGALQCIPKNPDCDRCIFNDRCIAFQKDAVHQYPVKKSRSKIRDRYLYYFVLVCKVDQVPHYYLRKRDNKGIWKNLYDFPAEESESPLSPDTLWDRSLLGHILLDQGATLRQVSPEMVHQLTHQRLHATFLKMDVDKKIRHPYFNSLHLIPREDMEEYPVPRLIDRYLREQKIIESHGRT